MTLVALQEIEPIAASFNRLEQDDHKYNPTNPFHC
jgi:hypothetical protein